MVVATNFSTKSPKFKPAMQKKHYKNANLKACSVAVSLFSKLCYKPIFLIESFPLIEIIQA